MPAIGIDIGSSSIKLIQLGGNKKRPILEAFGLGVNPVAGLDVEGEAQKTQLIQTIKKLVTDSGIKQGKTVVALPEAKAYTKVIEMPVLSESELASAIGWEAEQYIPIPISEVQLDYRIISKPDVASAAAKMKVFLVAAPLKVVSRVLAVLEAVGLEPEAMETEVLGLSRSLVKDPSASPVLSVHFGASTTDISVLEAGMIVFTRSVPTGGNALSRVLAGDLGLQLTQAEQYKRSYGLDESQLQGKVRNSLQTVFASIIGEMRKAIHFYSADRKGKVERIVLSGGGAYLPEVTSVLAKDLGLEVIVGNPFLGVEMTDRQKKRIGGIGSVFAVAVGLAMRLL